MKALVCELCGGNELIKGDDDLFQCQHCGTKYTVEAARKLLVDGVVQVKAADFLVEGGILRKYAGEHLDVEVPETVVHIGDEAFKGLAIRSVRMPSTVTTVGECAFEDCASLERVELSPNTAKIGSHAFCGCKSLADMAFPEGLEVIGAYAFQGCSRLTRANLPRSLKEIGDGAFRLCSDIVHIELPGTIQLYGGRIFNGCPNIKTGRVENKAILTDWKVWGGSPVADNPYMFEDKTARPSKPTCPQCGTELVRKKKMFLDYLACPNCNYVS